MAIDLEFLKEMYFELDQPVPYALNNQIIRINPIILKDSVPFMNSIEVLTLDKNSIPSPEIIQMSYLDFIINILFNKNKNNANRLAVILKYCLNMESVKYGMNEKGKYFLFNEDNNIKITNKQFEDIRRIILYQNLINYNDDYINPELKQRMIETDFLKSKNIEPISLERKIAIITSHCGISKQDQIQMTLRSHSLLFKEVCEEVEYTTFAPLCALNGKVKDIEHWIHKKKKNKFDGYITSVSSFAKSAGIGEIK